MEQLFHLTGKNISPKHLLAWSIQYNFRKHISMLFYYRKARGKRSRYDFLITNETWWSDKDFRSMKLASHLIKQAPVWLRYCSLYRLFFFFYGILRKKEIPIQTKQGSFIWSCFLLCSLALRFVNVWRNNLLDNILVKRLWMKYKPKKLVARYEFHTLGNFLGTHIEWNNKG